MEQLKRDVLASITVPNPETIKEDILKAIPSIPNYTVSLEEDTLVLTKEGDTSYRKTIDLSKYKDPTVNVEQIKNEILSAVDTKIPTSESIKNAVLTEVNPKLIDKENLKTEILSAIPSSPNYTLSLDDNTLKLGKEGDDSYSKTIDLSKYLMSPRSLLNSISKYSVNVSDGAFLTTMYELRTILLMSGVEIEATISDDKSSINLVFSVDDNIYNDYFPNYTKKPPKHTFARIPIYKLSNAIASYGSANISDILNTIKRLSSNHPSGELDELVSDLAEVIYFAAPELKYELNRDNTILNLVYEPSSDAMKYFPNETNKTPHLIVASMTRDKLKTLLGPISATDNHTLSLDDNTLKLGKESDPNYSKTVDLSKYVNGPSIDVEQLKKDVLGAIPSMPEYTLSIEGNTLKLGKEGDNSYSKTVILPVSSNGSSVDIEQLKRDIVASMAESNKKTIKEEVSRVIPTANTSYIEGHGRPDKKDELNNARFGTTYVDLDRTDGAYIWMKKTKWSVIEGDTGEIDFNQTLLKYCKIRRINNTVIISPYIEHENNLNRDVFYIDDFVYDTDDDDTIKASHSDQKGFSPMVRTVIPITWFHDLSQDRRSTWNEEMNSSSEKYVSYSGRFIVNKSTDQSKLAIIFQPDFGLFPDHNDVYARTLKVDMSSNDSFHILAQNLTYETDESWPELS